MDAATIYIRFYFRVASLPSATEQVVEIRDTGGAVKAQLRLESAGTFRLVDALPAGIATSSTAIVVNTWYRIEWLVPTGTSATSTLKIDGAQVASAGGNFGTVNTGTIRLGKATNVNGASVEYYYDDLCVKDNDWPGEGAVVILKPTGDGTYTAWLNETGSDSNNYLSVLEVPYDSDTTYITSTTNTNAETFALRNLSTVATVTSAYITAVKTFVIARRVTLNVSFKSRLRSGSFDSDSTSISAAPSYTGYPDMFENDPNTLDPWTVTGVDGIEVGVVHATVDSREVRCTAVYAMVDYIPNLQSTADLWQVNDINIVRPSTTVSHVGQAYIDTVNDCQTIRGLTSVSSFTTVDFHTISSSSVNGGFILNSNAECFVASVFNSVETVSHIASAELQTISSIKDSPALVLISDVYFNTVTSFPTQGFIVGQIDGMAGIDSIVSLAANGMINIKAASDINTITSINQNAGLSLGALINIHTVSQLNNNPTVNLMGQVSLAEICEIISVPTKNLISTADLAKISLLNGSPRVLLIGAVGVGTISDVTSTTVVLSNQNVCEFYSVLNLNSEAAVQHSAVAKLDTLSEIRAAAGITKVSTAEFGGVTLIDSSAHISIDAVFVASLGIVSQLDNVAKVNRGGNGLFFTYSVVTADGNAAPTVWEQRNMAMVMEIRPDLREVIGEVVNLTLYVTPAYRD